jgi:hypothetical protein
MAAKIPRRPEVPGAPGMTLPAGTPQRAIREVTVPIPDDDEPTNPIAPISGVVARNCGLTIRHLTRAEAGQLALIIAAWEFAEGNDRTLLAEFAKRLAANRSLRSQLIKMIRDDT